jgi:fumarate reductase flavoprotein subunit
MDDQEIDGPDLVVAGAGGGLVAALRAAELGLSVLVVESSEASSRGNNTAMSTAMIPGAGSKWQREAGIDDSPDDFVADIMAKTKGTADRELATALAMVSAPLVEWLADDAGLPLSLVTDFSYPGHSSFRCHTVPGRAGRSMLRLLLDRVRASHSIDLYSPARLVDVEVTEGAVSAAIVETGSGRERIPVRAVLLATNGFGADPALVREHIPEIADAIYYGSDQSRGDALRIGERLGAATAYLDAYQGHAAVAMPSATLAGWATVMHGGFLVNQSGDRFGDETTGYSEYARESVEHADGRAWIIIDRRIHDACLNFQDFTETVKSKGVRWAADGEGLAAATGIDASGLVRTLEQAHQFASSDSQDQWGRRFWEAPLEGELGAIFVQPALFHTQGGLRVDGNARVLDRAGATIPGLYASGGAAMGISGHGSSGYLAGNGLLPAMGLAFLAANDVAARRAVAHPTPDSAVPYAQ